MLILVDNAIKYTPSGGEVSLSLRKHSGATTLEVADTGIGISAEDLPHIFERFYRADKSRMRSASGTGLGLAIAKWIAEQHGGEISVKSSPGVGTTFTIRLPLARHRRKLARPGLGLPRMYREILGGLVQTLLPDAAGRDKTSTRLR